jgi:hypothetical protein
MTKRIDGEWIVAWMADAAHYSLKSDDRGRWVTTLCGFVMPVNVRFWTEAQAVDAWGSVCRRCKTRLKVLDDDARKVLRVRS